MPDLVELLLTEDIPLPENAAWARGHTVRIPADLASILTGAQDSSRLRRVAAEASRSLRERRAMTPEPPTSSRLPINYQLIPGWARRIVARVIGARKMKNVGAWASFPGWPLDLSADFAADLAGVPHLQFTQTPVLLSHDIDTAEGLVNAQKHFLPLEEAVGAYSVNYIVPCGWDIDHRIVGAVKSRGHEIGVHGYDHANKTPFIEGAERFSRLKDGAALAKRYEGNGYRAPSLLRTRELIYALEGLYRYDSSIPTSGGPFPVANNGCASARPWRISGKMWEIPLTMPRDGSLRFLGYSPDQILKLWLDCAEHIADSGGVVFLLTHCEGGFSGNAEMLRIYEAFLSAIARDSRFAFTTPTALIDAMEREGF